MRKYFVLVFVLIGVWFLPSPVLATATAQEKIETVDIAQAGMWRVEIKGNATGNLAILAQKITAPLVVRDITVVQADDSISIDFQITGEPGECQYEVSLALNGQTSSTRILQTGTAAN
ncbi:MAG: hypothetical protein WCG21_10315 [Eubacteriales bacterium]